MCSLYSDGAFESSTHSISDVVMPNDPVLPREWPDRDWLPPVVLSSIAGPTSYSS